MERPEINFEGTVSVPFFSSVLKLACKSSPFRTSKQTLSIEDMELIRRACAVIEAVASGAFKEQSPRPVPTNHENAW